MEYSVRVWSAMQGDVVPLIYVAQAMARHAASGHGTMSIHGPTLEEIRPGYIAVLLDAANRGDLTVCNQFGRIASVKELADEAEVAVDAEEMNILIHLYTKAHSLGEWGRTRGDVFHFAETPGTVEDSDLRSFTEAGFGEVLEARYYRNALGGGESEPFVPVVAGASIDAKAAQNKSTKTPRRDTITPVIELAQSKCIDPNDTAAVWAHMEVLAIEEYPPFQGRMLEGLQYTKNNKVHYFTRDALRLRLHPEFRAPRK